VSVRRAADGPQSFPVGRSGARFRGARTVLGETRVVGERLLEPPARIRPLRRCRSGEEEDERSQIRGAPRHRSVAPVFLLTSATTLAMTASISASVSVRSRGCNVTAIATDFEPSGTPAPR